MDTHIVTDYPRSAASLILSCRNKHVGNKFNAANISINLAVKAQRKRRGLDDAIQEHILSFEFVDDNRFTHLEGVLMRFVPGLDVVHLAIDSGLMKQIGPEASDKLTKSLCTVINETAASTCTDDNGKGIVRVLNKGNKNPLQNLSPETIDEWMKTLLVENSPQHLAYNGSRHFTDGAVMVQKTLGVLIREEELLNLDDIVGKISVSAASLSSHLAMDRTAAESINLVPDINHHSGSSTTNSSIYSVLNQCKTKMGERLLMQWLRQPLVNLQEINSRHDMVEYLVDQGVGRDTLRDIALKGCTDIDRLSARLQKGNAKLEQLYELYIYASSQLPVLLDALRDVCGSDTDTDTDMVAVAFHRFVKGLEEVNENLLQLRNLVETVMDLDVAPREYLIKAEFDPALAEYKAQLDQIDVELERLHEEIDAEWSEISGQSSGMVRLEDTSGKEGLVGSWQFRLPKQNDLKLIDKHWTKTGQVTVHRVLKNGVYFSTQQLRELGCQKQDILESYSSGQKKVVDDAMEVTKTYCPVLEKASLLISELDVLCSFAHVASYAPQTYCRPVMTDEEKDGLGIILKNARHPCVELQEGVNFIPNDYDMKFGSSSFHIITGPNMGGKSTYIRALGAIVTMAQVGAFVPCDSAEINIVHSILARVGAGDKQQRGISTFMAEMLEASSILRSATKRSLIIIDELGRGTSTFDGFGLAWSISEYIVRQLGCITVFATHFHELTALEDHEERVTNCHVSAHKMPGSNELTFLYEVKPGPCLESFGIQVAEMANCPQSMIAEAKRKAKELECFDYKNKKQRRENGNEQESNDVKAVQSFMNIPIRSMVTPDEKLSAARSLIKQFGL